MPDDLTGYGLTDAQKRLVTILKARSKKIVVEAFGQLRKDLDEVTTKIDRRLSHVEEALR
jgi:hypothetical protein